MYYFSPKVLAWLVRIQSLKSQEEYVTFEHPDDYMNYEKTSPVELHDKTKEARKEYNAGRFNTRGNLSRAERQFDDTLYRFMTTQLK